MRTQKTCSNLASPRFRPSKSFYLIFALSSASHVSLLLRAKFIFDAICILVTHQIAGDIPCRKCEPQRSITPSVYPSKVFPSKLQSFLPYSSGSSTPILLADSRTLSASSIFMPGLYLSSNVTYVLCARTYARYCSACATPFSLASDDVSEWKCSRRRS